MLFSKLAEGVLSLASILLSTRICLEELSCCGILRFRGPRLLLSLVVLYAELLPLHLLEQLPHHGARLALHRRPVRARPVHRAILAYSDKVGVESEHLVVTLLDGRRLRAFRVFVKCRKIVGLVVVL